MGPGENTREVGAAGDRAIAAYRELQDEGKLTARVSVSYTHLDVYKRQVDGRLRAEVYVEDEPSPRPLRRDPGD